MKKYFTLILLLFWTIYLFAGVGDWTTFTNQGDIRDLILIEDYIWCATNGGVFKYEISTGTFTQYYNTNGLSSLDARAIEVDQHGTIWVGFSDGYLNCFNPETNSWNFVDDYLGHQIYDLQAINDSLLVALDIGISLYDIKRHEVKETYKNLGWQIPIEIPVLNITINKREIWAGTEYGIAKSSFDLANLMAPESWTNYTSNQGLPSNTINSIVIHNDTVFVATNSGVAFLSDQVWTVVNTGLSSTEIIALASSNGQLYAMTSTYITLWETASQIWSKITPSLVNLHCLVLSAENLFWVGRKKTQTAYGIGYYSPQEGQWTEIIPPGPPGNDISCLAIDHQGILWCGSITDGVFRYDENAPSESQKWQQFTTRDGLLTNRIESIAIDPQNRKWIGTTGGGVAIIEEIDSVTTIQVIHKEILSGIEKNPDYVVITEVKIDRFNNVWMLNLEAKNHNVVAIYTPQMQWQFFAMQEGFLSYDVRALDFDQYDRVWVASDGGVNVIDYNNTLMDKRDDDYSGTLTTLDGLESNHVKDIAIDQDNIVWIGTDAGLNYWDRGQVYYQFGLLSNSINVVNIDIRNNKWIGTSDGLSVLAPDGYTLTHYTTENSPLVSDNITSFAFDLESGKVYIGTTNGLSCFETPYSKPRENLDNIMAGPNPFIVRQHQSFAISNLADDVSVKFITENGMVVRQILKDNILGSQVIWDGKNDAGEYVSSGIYLFVIYNEETGMNRVGKVAVIH